MLSPLRNRFGIPGVISVIALVFAMMGGAYAANNDDGGSKASASAKKAKRGPKGPKGAKGDPGPAGPQGPAGANGKDGSNGTNGTNGANGTSAQVVAFTGSKGPIGGVTCTAGGVEVKSASPAVLVCNGKNGTNGANGTNGSPWAPENALPEKATETGTWAYGNLPTGTLNQTLYTAISFPVPLSDPLDAAHVHYVDASGNEQPGNTPPTACSDDPGASADPTAAPGHLCVYETVKLFMTFEKIVSASDAAEGGNGNGAATSGALLGFLGESEARAYGTYAVTGAEEE